MPTGNDWTVWICSSCRRRVPGHLVECRCGSLRAHALGVISSEEESSGSSVLPKVAAGAAFAVALAGSWAWFVRIPAAVPSAPPVTAVSSTAAPAGRTIPVVSYTPPPAAEAPFPSPLPAWSPILPGPEAPMAESGRGSRTALGGPVATPPPPLSDWDRARLEGRRRLASEFAALAGNARRLIGLVRRYEGKHCQGRDDGDCRALLEQIGLTALAVGASMEKTEDIARTSLLDPGVVRDMRAQHGLDDSLWDQIERITREYRR
jgi:hypothetical protein